jgi:hypothetical protein
MIDDMYSLLSWAKDEELKAHNFKSYPRAKAFREMIDKIEKSPTELHRTLTLPMRF